MVIPARLSPRGRLDLLPEAILDEIANCLDQGTSYSLCLTCRVLVWPSRRSLYHSLCLDNKVPNRGAYSELRALSGQEIQKKVHDTVTRNPEVAALVYELTCEAPTSDISATYLADILSHCVNLRSFSWTAGLEALKWESILLHAFEASSFSSYAIRAVGCAFGCIAPSRRLENFTLEQLWSTYPKLAIFPAGKQIQAEHVSFRALGEHYGDPVEIPRCVSGLRPPASLCLDLCAFDWSAFSELMQWAGASLENFEVRRCELFEVGIWWPDEQISQVVPYRHALMNLQSLITDTLAYPFVAVPSLRSLTLLAPSESNMTILVSWLRSGSLPLLSTLHLSPLGSTRPLNLETLTALEGACTSTGVKVLPDGIIDTLKRQAERLATVQERESEQSCSNPSLPLSDADLDQAFACLGHNDSV